MRIQIKQQILINAPAYKVWRVLAHEFDHIELWSSGIEKSYGLPELSTPEDAPVGGRVCIGTGPIVQEAFTYYDEVGMRFGYQALNQISRFINSAENNWQVEEVEPMVSSVSFRAEIDAAFFVGMLMQLLRPILVPFLGTRTLEELKYYVEHDRPHPRKQKALQRQSRAA